MTAQTLLSRLERVRSVGQGRWVASCPTRRDRHPSLSVRELDDGRVLVHDFGGDSVEEILGAVGLTFADLFPERDTKYTKSERMPFSHAQALRCISMEATLAAVAACNLSNGFALTADDKNRLLLASSRINHALEVCGCR